MPIVAAITLNSVCRPAVRFAAKLPPIAANTPVTVVPMQAPKTNGIAAFKVIAPDSYNFWTTPIVAAEPWISPVSTVPASKPSSGFSDITLANSMKAGRSFSIFSESPMIFRP